LSQVICQLPGLQANGSDSEHRQDTAAEQGTAQPTHHFLSLLGFTLSLYQFLCGP